MNSGEDGAQRVPSGPAGFVGRNSNADQEVGLSTQLHPPSSPFGKNCIHHSHPGTLHHKTPHTCKKSGVITHRESHAYLANHFETV